LELDVSVCSKLLFFTIKEAGSNTGQFMKFLRTTTAIIIFAFSAAACSSAAPINSANVPANALSGSGNNIENNSEKQPTPIENSAERVAIADGRDNFEPKEASSDDTKFVDAEFAAKEAAILKESNFECDADAEKGVTVLGTVSGSFTKAGATQKAYLYERCRAGRSFGIGGIVIGDGGKVVTHYIFGENGLFAGINSLKDINKNGIDEIVLSAVGSGQGYSTADVSLYEFSDGKLSFMGSAETFSSNDGAVEKEADILSSAYKISVQSGKEPMFFRDTFERKGTSTKWNETSKNEKMKLNTETPSKFSKIA